MDTVCGNLVYFSKRGPNKNLAILQQRATIFFRWPDFFASFSHQFFSSLFTQAQRVQFPPNTMLSGWVFSNKKWRA
jgi:hypothetical protein